MTETETNQVINKVKDVLNKITECSQEAQLDCFLEFYHNYPAFLHISADGKMSNYNEFKQICTEYYTSLNRQKIYTTRENFNVLDENHVITGWTGNISAQFKNGNLMNMNNYSVSHVFKKIGGDWKVVYAHESSLPPELITQG